MFHKIEKLTSIGKFRDFSAQGDIAFKPLTVIYAENGSGKTTLAAIFRSIATNNSSLIIKRISTNNTQPQFAQLYYRTDLTNSATQSSIIFNNGAWSNSHNVVEVFDVHFIADNIYSGFEFTNDHRKQLHHFIVGAQGILIKQQIEQNKEDRRLLGENINNRIEQLLRNVGNGLTSTNLREFFALQSAATNVDHIIATAETALLNAKQNSVIQTIQLLQTISPVIVPINFSQIETDIATTIETIKNDVLSKLFRSHCDELRAHQVPQPENWVKVGFSYMQHNDADIATCPFCKQSIDNSLDIIQAYTQQFDEAFNAYLNRIATHLERLSTFNIDTLLQSQNTIIASNNGRTELWKPLLGNENVVLSNVIVPNIEAIKGDVTEAIAILTSKMQNPTTALELSSFTRLTAHISNINELIETYNVNVVAINITAQAFKNGIQTEQQAEQALQTAKRIKARFDVANTTLIAQLNTDKTRLAALERDYRALVTQEETDSINFLTQYAVRINHYLQNVFRTPFAIQQLQHIRPAGRATESRVGYNLTIHGHSIQFDTLQANSVKECFSEGDRSTVALAFFLAKLDIDPNRADKIVIFDDPLSSFDTHRRGYTVEIIKSLASSVKQVIVLSHNEFFLHDIYTRATVQKKALSLTINAVQDSSAISIVDLNDMVDTSYFRNVRILERFLLSASIVDRDYVRGLIRVVIESKLKFNFHRELSGVPPGSRTFGRIITTLENANVVFRDGLNTPNTFLKLKELNGISWQPHHGDPEPEMISNGYNSSSMTVTELINYITDTLDVLYNKI